MKAVTFLAHDNRRMLLTMTTTNNVKPVLGVAPDIRLGHCVKVASNILEFQGPVQVYVSQAPHLFANLLSS